MLKKIGLGVLFMLTLIGFGALSYPRQQPMIVVLVFSLLMGSIWFRLLYGWGLPKEKPRLDLNWLAISVLSGFGLVIVVFGVVWLYRWFGISFGTERYGEFIRSNLGWQLLAVRVIGAPLLEEVVMRGYVQEELLSKLPVWVRVGISAMLFAMLHGTLIHLAIGFIGGLVFGLLYVKSKQLWVPVLAHVAYNTFSLGIDQLAVGFVLVCVCTMYLLIKEKKKNKGRG